MKMQKYAALFFALAVDSAAAQSCAVLDYQEMKEMSQGDLIREACSARNLANQSYQKGIGILSSRQIDVSAAQSSFDQCLGQLRRIERALETKGVEKATIPSACKKINDDDAERLRKALAK